MRVSLRADGIVHGAMRDRRRHRVPTVSRSAAFTGMATETGPQAGGRESTEGPEEDGVDAKARPPVAEIRGDGRGALGAEQGS